MLAPSSCAPALGTSRALWAILKHLLSLSCLLLSSVAAQPSASILGGGGASAFGAGLGFGGGGIGNLGGLSGLSGLASGLAGPGGGFGGILGGGASSLWLGGSASSTSGASDGAAVGGGFGGLGFGAGAGAGLLGSAGAGLPGLRAPPTLHRAFHYADIASHLLEKPTPIGVEACRQRCVATPTCAAWEVCAPLGDGCEGCYLVTRAPRQFAERPGWHAAVLEGREDLGWSEEPATAMTAEECHDFLLNANGADQSQPFHEPAIMQKYVNCGFMLRDAQKPRQVAINGQHYPTFLVTNFWDPPVGLPEDIERSMLSSSARQQRPLKAVPVTAGITAQLHGTVGTTEWEQHTRQKPNGPHAFVIPYYDTNIGHWMKQHGSMNPMQSYEMQSLLRAGDTVIDVGANLGCYTIPFAERVGAHGKVLAFEPFRWLHQVTSGNVAINGLSNVWVLPVGLGSEFARFEARPPQLRFFSSPGGVRLTGQQDGLKPEEAMQLYDWDAPPELITVVSLDALMLQRSADTAALGAPHIDDVRLIKIDVEGMEKEVIAGARQLIERFKPIVWTENVAYFSSKGEDTSLLQLFEQLDYGCAQAENAPNDIVCTNRQGLGHQIS